MDYKRTLGLGFKNPFARTFMVLEFFTLMFTMIFLLYLVSQTMDSVIAAGVQEGKVIPAEWSKEVNRLLLIRIPILFMVIFLINVVLGLLYLHRLLGPIERVRKVLDGLVLGKLPEGSVSFRRDDYPTDLGNSLVRLIKKIKDMRK